VRLRPLNECNPKFSEGEGKGCNAPLPKLRRELSVALCTTPYIHFSTCWPYPEWRYATRGRDGMGLSHAHHEARHLDHHDLGWAIRAIGNESAVASMGYVVSMYILRGAVVR
jgi:hypothetical protein